MNVFWDEKRERDLPGYGTCMQYGEQLDGVDVVLHAACLLLLWGLCVFCKRCVYSSLLMDPKSFVVVVVVVSDYSSMWLRSVNNLYCDSII